MAVLKISLRNFRGVADREIVFGGRKNLIKGPNEIGKTTIAHALAFGYYGVDLHGVKNPDHLITLGQDEAQVAIQSENSTFIRRKKRGKVSDVKIVRDGFPDLKPNQTELTKMLGMEYDLFGSSFMTGYFMALTDQKKREVISQAWKADRPTLLKQVLDEMNLPGYVWDPRLVKLENPRLDASAVARERTMNQNKALSDEGSLAQVRAQIQEAMGIQGDSDALAEMEARLKQLRAEVNLVELYERDLRTYQNAMNTYAEVEAENKRRLARQEKLKLEIEALGEAPQVDVADLEKKQSELMAQSTALRLLPVPEKPAIPNKLLEDTCTRCGQKVGDKLKEDIAAERDRLTMEFNQRQREVADKNTEILRQKDGVDADMMRVSKDISSRKHARTEWETKKRYHDSLMSELVTKPNPMPSAPEMTVQVPAGAAGPKEELRVLEAKYQAQKLMEGRASSLTGQEQNLIKSLEVKKETIRVLQVLQDALEKLPNVEVQATMEKFALHKAQVAFVDGEIIVNNDQGLPYLSLSDGRRMKVDLEWVKCFQRLVPRAPKFIFIDNSDLVDSFDGYLPNEIQIFMAQVVADLKQLEVVQL